METIKLLLADFQRWAAAQPRDAETTRLTWLIAGALEQMLVGGVENCESELRMLQQDVDALSARLQR